MLKISCIYNTTAYVNLFNTLLKSGIYPELWRENYIKPIFKGALSNAFLKFIKQTYRHFDTLKALSIRHFKVKM
jgi:hypothetical protein